MPDLRDKLLLPTVPATVAGLIVGVLLSAAKSSAFWTVTGAVLTLVVVAVLVYLFARMSRSIAKLATGLERTTKQLDATDDRLQRERGAATELAREVARLSDRLAVAEAVALPQWLSVAIRHHERRGGTVTPEPNGLRFAEPNGHLVLMVPVHWTDAADELSVNQLLHDRLGISQNDYLNALIGAE